VSLRFTKMEGCGNDYVYVELFTQSLTLAAAPALARAVSDRHFGIGADGLILVAPEPGSDGRMVMFNRDGSRGRMCGNGIRCVARLLHDRGFASGPRLRIATDAGAKEVELHLESGQVAAATVDMGAPELAPERVPMMGPATVLEALDQRFAMTALSMGNPHCVVFLDQDLDGFAVARYGPAIERHALFPEGTNVEFVTAVGPRVLRQRTWERGAGETLACGTGACAATVAATLRGLVERGVEVAVELRGGTLRTRWDADRVWMTGPARTVFDGVWPD